MKKVRIEKLPVTKEMTGAKRWYEKKGEFSQIAYQEEIRHLAVFEIRKGFSRGNHYHEKKEEVFYVLKGKLRVLFLDMDSREKEETILEKGDKIRIKPRVSHLFYGIEDSLVVEYSPQPYEDGDGYKVDLESEWSLERGCQG